MSNVGALPQGFGDDVDPPPHIEMQIYDALPAHIRVAMGQCTFDVSPYRMACAIQKYNMTDVEVLDNLRRLDAMLLAEFRREIGKT